MFFTWAVLVQAGTGDGVGDRREADRVALRGDKEAGGHRPGGLPDTIAGNGVLSRGPSSWQSAEGKLAFVVAAVGSLLEV